MAEGVGKCKLKATSECSAAQDDYEDWQDTAEEKKVTFISDVIYCRAFLTVVGQCETFDWEKTCDFYGTYEPVQAKYNVYHPLARKFCTDIRGNRQLVVALNGT